MGDPENRDQYLVLLGEIKGIGEATRDHVAKMADKIDVLETSVATTCVRINGHETRLTRVEQVLMKAVIIGVLLIAGGAAAGGLASKLISMLGM